MEIDVTNAEWVGARTNLKQEFNGKYVMEWGFYTDQHNFEIPVKLIDLL